MTSTRIKAAALLLSIALQGSVAAAAERPATLTMSFTGFETRDGAIMVGLYNTEAAFSGDDAPFRGVRVKVTGDKATTVITGLAPGRYAAKVFHDLDNDGKLGANLFGIPTEPYAASNNPPPRMGPPLWRDAVFEVGPGANAQTIHID